jgi:hypothetical protein
MAALELAWRVKDDILKHPLAKTVKSSSLAT